MALGAPVPPAKRDGRDSTALPPRVDARLEMHKNAFLCIFTRDGTILTVASALNGAPAASTQAPPWVRREPHSGDSQLCGLFARSMALATTTRRRMRLPARPQPCTRRTAIPQASERRAGRRVSVYKTLRIHS